jgi:hypothetical protein
MYRKKLPIFLLTMIIFGMTMYFLTATYPGTVTYSTDQNNTPTSTSTSVSEEKPTPQWPTPLDKKEYDSRLLAMVHYVPLAPIIATSTSTDGSISTTTKQVSDLRYATSTNVTIEGSLWPKAQPYPNGDALLPFYRILAYYGNFYSTRMGILGELEPDQMLEKLQQAKTEWENADPDTPVLPAIEYIAIVAQGSAGADGMYRAVMPDEEIDKAYGLAQEIDGVLILDLQVGKSTIQKELPKFKTYLERPDVHLALDPEFSMKTGKAPGTVIGSYDASDINYVIGYFTDIVRENKLPPKVLLVHRFTTDMVTDATSIAPQPEVQVVMVMDGWGPKSLKYGTYEHVIKPEPVQFTGIKIFYKNDLKPPSTGLMTPADVLDLNPKPLYIQYQ